MDESTTANTSEVPSTTNSPSTQPIDIPKKPENTTPVESTQANSLFSELFTEKQTIIPDDLKDVPVLNLSFVPRREIDDTVTEENIEGLNQSTERTQPVQEDDEFMDTVIVPNTPESENETEDLNRNEIANKRLVEEYHLGWFRKPNLLPLPFKRIMCVGDSITAGNQNMSYRPYLFSLLRQQGVEFDFVGSQGVYPLQHDAFGGHAAHQVRSKTTAHFRSLSPDILLVHVGHNSHASTKPIDKIMQNIDFMVHDYLRAKPEGIVFLSEVISSLNMRVYSYIEGLNDKLREYATNTEHVMFIPQENFDATRHLQHDGIHPNTEGCEVMAQNFFAQIIAMYVDPNFTTKAPEPEPLIEAEEVAISEVNHEDDTIIMNEDD